MESFRIVSMHGRRRSSTSRLLAKKTALRILQYMIFSPRSEAIISIRKFGILLLVVNNFRDFREAKVSRMPLHSRNLQTFYLAKLTCRTVPSIILSLI